MLSFKHQICESAMVRSNLGEPPGPVGGGNHGPVRAIGGVKSHDIEAPIFRVLLRLSHEQSQATASECCWWVLTDDFRRRSVSAQAYNLNIKHNSAAAFLFEVSFCPSFHHIFWIHPESLNLTNYFIDYSDSAQVKIILEQRFHIFLECHPQIANLVRFSPEKCCIFH